MAGALFPHPPLAQHQLLDSGGGEKLERYGGQVLRRPDPQALWRPRLGPEAWRQAGLSFVRESDRGGRWEPDGGPSEWPLVLGAELGLPPVTLLIRPTPFKHLGLFPEQAANWAWTEQRRRALAAAGLTQPELLNLFAYTGAASLLAARSGWKVTHVDAARPALDWAAANARASGLAEGSVRWVLDDAAAFAAREARRGRRYHGILLDPPHYGRGPRGEAWQFEDGIAPLLEACGRLLAADAPSFLVLSTYAIGYSPLAFENLLRELGAGAVESGELAIPEAGQGQAARLLPCGFCARYLRA